jgi:two-component system KDP operon response regulator KdpE
MSAPPIEPAVLLLVEDDPTNRALVRAVLSRAPQVRLRDALVTETATLAGARAALASIRPDVVLLDVRLPDGNGLDLARDLALEGRLPTPRVVVMSASVLPAERDAAMAAGGDVFMAKPFRPAELIELLAKWMIGPEQR